MQFNVYMFLDMKESDNHNINKESQVRSHKKILD